ncbi:hypothetical protein MOP88_14465 [Sphingomonas sp. WKB10]|nr:hypothetical protein [Sphingomonas sp. WKB10]
MYGIEYRMPFSGSQAEMNDLMRKRYGAPTGTTPTNGGPAPIYSTPIDQRQNAFIRAHVNNQVALILVEDKNFSQMSQSSKELTTAVTQLTGGSKVKM